jgi:hypothetical protein
MMRRLTKKELLERYQAREPRLYIQIDAVKTIGNEDNLMPPDEDGFWFQARHTYELMDGADISVLVNPRTDRKDVVGMLKKLIIKMDQDWSYLLDEAKDELATAQGVEGIVESLIRIRGFQLNDFERLAQAAREKLQGKTVQSDDDSPFW